MNKIALAFTLCLTACFDAADDPGTTAAEFGGGGGGGEDPCPSWGCTSNSPQIETWQFHELEETGAQYNSAHIRLLRLVKNGITYTPDVVGARLYGHNATYGTISGAALTGAYFEVETPGGLYDIIIHKVSNVTPYWVGPATFNETYELQSEIPGIPTTLQPLCKNPPSYMDDEGSPWPRTLEALMFTGDRYDADTKTVTAASYAAAGTWFNIACAGSALAKLHLNRHTTAGQITGFVSTQMTRQAMLKMYVADVCGAGKAFTRLGTPLRWDNRFDWKPLPATVSAYEGLWGPYGAICIDHFRLEDDPDYETIFKPAMELSCGGALPPKCTATVPGFPTVWTPSSYLITAIP